VKKIIITIIVIAIVLIGSYFLFKGTSQAPVLEQSTATQQSNTPSESNITPTPNPSLTPTQTSTKNEVIYNDSGYLPATLTIKVGETVTFKNQSSNGMWTASAMHPSHTIYSGTSLDEHCPNTANTSFDECTSAQPGESWSFTFNKKGTWGYHNHVKAMHFGKIIVE